MKMKLKRCDAVLFQGDSITNAFRMPQEVNDCYQMGSGYAMLVAARIRAERPQDRITFFNRGVSGNGIQDLLARWRPDCLDLRPDVLSILIGVNDALAMGSIEEWGQHYRRLLAMTRKELPKTRIILCEPFLLPVGKISKAMLENMAERQREFSRIVADEDVAVVMLQKVFNQASRQAPADYWAYDGIHPTAAGAGLIARAWLKLPV
jgi:lysophospholipase L1-like esterase